MSKSHPRIAGYLLPRHTEDKGLPSPLFLRRKPKKEWIVLDEVSARLLAYPTEEMAHNPKKEPLYTISLVNAAFGVELNPPLSFNIVSGRKYIFQAETQSAMNTWLIHLQNCRQIRNEDVRRQFDQTDSTLTATSSIHRRISEQHLLRTTPRNYSFTSEKSGILKLSNVSMENFRRPISVSEHRLDSHLSDLRDSHFDFFNEDKLTTVRVPSPTFEHFNNLIAEEHASDVSEETYDLLKREHQQTLEIVEQLQKRNLELESENMDLRIGYASLVRTCLTFRLESTLDASKSTDFPISKKHKKRIFHLLDNAKTQDPGLPSGNLLSIEAGHTDAYGFQHTFTNEDTSMVYVANRLLEVLCASSVEEEVRIRNWTQILDSDFSTIPRQRLKQLCRMGIPAELREQVWTKLIDLGLGGMKTAMGSRYYQQIVYRVNDTEVELSHRQQIMLDVMRTFPQHIAFNRADGFGVQKMQEVLQAFTIHDPAVGYCQGMNFIVGNALLLLDKETTFWLLVLFIEHHFCPNYFNAGLIAAQADQGVLRDLVARYCPELSDALTKMEIDLSTITFNWFIAVFVNCVPLETVLRIWDVFLLEGTKVLFRISIALLLRTKDILLRQPDTLTLWKNLKCAVNLTYDVDEIFDIAFKGFKMVKRKELRTRHVAYRRDVERRIQRTSLFRDIRLDDQFNLNSDFYQQIPSRLFSVSNLGGTDSPNFLMCFAQGSKCELKYGNADHLSYYSLDIRFDAPILCASHINERYVLLGSAEGYLYAFNIEDRSSTWELKISSCVTAIAIGRRDDDTQQAFVGSANGTLSLIVDLTCEKVPQDQYSQILGYLAISAIVILGDHVWCACGCVVEVFDVKTFDHVRKITLSENPIDSVLTLTASSVGVWVSMVGHTKLDLWCSRTFQPLAYSVNTNVLPMGDESDTVDFENPDRVTAVIVSDCFLLMGTGSGTVIIYKILAWKNKGAHQQRPVVHSATFEGSADASPTTESSQSDSKTTSSVQIQSNLEGNLPKSASLLFLSRSQVTESSIRAFIHISGKTGSSVISFSQRGSEDDSLLKWSFSSRDGGRWTNAPLLEVDLKDSKPILPAYLKSAALRKISSIDHPGYSP